MEVVILPKTLPGESAGQTGPDIQVGGWSDAELVQMSLRDGENFALIIEKYQARLLRYLRWFLGVNQALAEDVLQETMIKVYRNLESFNPRFTFVSWVYRIAHNEALNFLRKQKKHYTVSLDDGEEGEASLINLLAAEDDVFGQAVRGELAVGVREVLALMSSAYREILILRYLDGYDYQEIGDILKKPLGTVGVMIARAKDQFKEKMNQVNLLNI